MPDTERPITARDLAVLTTTISELSHTVRDLRQSVESTYVRKDVLTTQMDELKRDVDSHTEAITWAVRLVLAAVIVALLSLVIVQGGVYK